ncbi:unnamed protein product [Cladocopium goreaui]|uniref:Protein YIPF5 n=1 Tax=Cladocopium goreaui TaxID=2562237 RepID=A0A9P1GNB3_9DINO|nr:unnamed protein product [Cladocopium goreaui]
MGSFPTTCFHKDVVAEEGSTTTTTFVSTEPLVAETDKVQQPEDESDDEDEYDKSSEDLWPLLKLQRQLEALSKLKPSLQERHLAVLLTTGAMNPLHRGHAQLLHQAVDRLQREGFDVVGAWLSPSHDGYVQPKARKMNTIGFSAQFRLEAARRAVSEDSLLAVGSWEAKKPGRWPDYPEVAMALQRKLRKVEKAWKLTNGLKAGTLWQKGLQGHGEVFYACGTDHAQTQGLYRGFLTDRPLLPDLMRWG